MSGYPNQAAGSNPEHPPPYNQIFPEMYSPYNVPPQPGQPAATFAVPGQNPQFPYHPIPGQTPGPMPYPGLASMGQGAAYTGCIPSVTPQPTSVPTIQWEPTTSKDAYLLENRALVAGHEGHDGSPLWVIRSRFQNNLIPGKLAVKHQSAYVAWGGKENLVQTIDVCCARPESVKWVPSSGGLIPLNAVLGGHTSDGEPLYIGRAHEQGSLTPGKVQPSHKVLYISFSGQEIPHMNYELLCTV